MPLTPRLQRITSLRLDPPHSALHRHCPTCLRCWLSDIRGLASCCRVGDTHMPHGRAAPAASGRLICCCLCNIDAQGESYSLLCANVHLGGRRRAENDGMFVCYWATGMRDLDSSENHSTREWAATRLEHTRLTGHHGWVGTPTPKLTTIRLTTYNLSTCIYTYICPVTSWVVHMPACEA